MSKTTVKRTRVTLSPEQAAAQRRRIEDAERDAPHVKRQVRSRMAEHEQMRHLLDELRDERQRQGVGLNELARRIEMDPSNLSRLENNQNANPTLRTLRRIAEALHKQVRFELADATDDPRAAA